MTSVETSLRDLAHHHDMVLETRKRDGSWVATPVNPIVEDDHVFFRTWSTSGKAKRLRNFPEVRFASSTARGHPTGPMLHGRSQLLGDGEADHAARLLNRKYPVLQGIGVRVYHALRHLETQHYVVTAVTSA